MINLLHLVLAGLGLGFLIFIHELGHYFVARRAGMTIEAFSIGFGKPLLTWERKGVKWKLCILPFGGYVRIAGMEKTGDLEPHQIADGFYGKKPIERIKVALAGPCVNLAFAFVAFTLLWAVGGREAPFSNYTHLIGSVDPESKLYELGVRAGDEITVYDGQPYQGVNTLLYASFLEGKTTSIKGYRIDYAAQKKEPFEYTLENYQNPFLKGVSTIGIISPASFLRVAEIPESSPFYSLGLQKGDRLVWIDGEFVFSLDHISKIINAPKALLTVERAGKVFLSRIPRLKISDLRLNSSQKAELDDWVHAAQVKTKLQQSYFIPYDLTSSAVVEAPLAYVDEAFCENNPSSCVLSTNSSLEIPLQRGDRVLAVDGIPIDLSSQLMAQLQTKHVQLIVQRGEKIPPLSWKNEDAYFEATFNAKLLEPLIASIGQKERQEASSSFYLIKPVVPKKLNEFPFTPEQKEEYIRRENIAKKEIEKIEDPERKQRALVLFEQDQGKQVLGIAFQDARVQYNPSPLTLFIGAFSETWKTLKALLTGSLSPKWMSGPIGIFQAMHYGWTEGIGEALYWMGFISFNLGILNLLPIPVLDGGHICFSLIESVTKKPIKAKIMERLIIPFIFLLAFFFIYVTYQDLSRLFHRFF